MKAMVTPLATMAASSLWGRCLASVHTRSQKSWSPSMRFPDIGYTSNAKYQTLVIAASSTGVECSETVEVTRNGEEGTHSSVEATVLQSEGAKRVKKPYFPKLGQDLELVCDSLAYKGLGVCRVVDTGFVVFCERALPGERLMARIRKKKKGFAEAYKLKTLSAHDNAVTAPCEHFGECGGCKTQNLAYEAQLMAKQQQVHELIARVGRFGQSPALGDPYCYMMPIVPCVSQYHYRNKMEFSFGTQKWTPLEEYLPASKEAGNVDKKLGEFALGLHAPGRFDKILPVNECLLQHDVANKVLELIQEFGEKNVEDLPPYNVHTYEGFLKHLAIRSGRDCNTGDLQLMVNVVTKSDNPELLQPLVHQITSLFPQVVSILNNVNTSIGPTSVGEKEHVLYGKGFITERLRGLVFEISANSFFQTNTEQAEVLYQRVEDECMLKGNNSEIILDLFCGTGTIGLSMAKKVKHVYGFELVPEAVADARRNAERNGIHNATFIRGDLNKLTEDFGRDFPHPDVVITDPNRPGMHPKLIRYLLQLKAPRIVYISCNPATCARDLDLLCHNEVERDNLPQSQLTNLVASTNGLCLINLV